MNRRQVYHIVNNVNYTLEWHFNDVPKLYSNIHVLSHDFESYTLFCTTNNEDEHDVREMSKPPIKYLRIDITRIGSQV